MGDNPIRRDNGDFHAGEGERPPNGTDPRPDWKVRLQAATLFWVVTASVFGLAAKFLAGYISDSTDKQLATHTALSVGELASLGKDIYSQLAAIDKRVTVLERNCIELERWRGATDSSISALQDWRTRCSTKQSELSEYVNNDRESVRRLDKRIDTLEQIIERRHPTR